MICQKDIIVKDTEGNKMKKMVEYEWKPRYCDKCKKFDHKCEKPTQVKSDKVWQPKTIQTESSLQVGHNTKATEKTWIEGIMRRTGQR